MYDHNGARIVSVVSFGVDYRNVHNPDIITVVPGITEETDNDAHA